MNDEKHNPYPKFFAMILTSTVVMMILMYLNTYEALIGDLEATKSASPK